MDLIAELGRTLFATTLAVLPIAAFMLAFHAFVLRRELVNQTGILAGFAFAAVGLALLLLGLERALFPLGRLMVEQLMAANVVDPDSPRHFTEYPAIYAFAFCVAFGAALAEPALLAVSLRVNEISGGAIRAGGLRVAAALGVASGVTLGCVRIVAGIPLHWCIGAVVMVIAVQTLLTPRGIVPLAYDAGGVSTTAVTVPVLAALGLGLAEQLPGRNPLVDGFGLVVLACLLTAVVVLGYAQMAWLLDRIQSRRDTTAARRHRAGKEE